MYPAPSNPHRAAETDSPFLQPPSPRCSFSHALSLQDPNGIHLRALYLASACRMREKYRSLGISEEIFPDTMGCFSAFCWRLKPVPASSYLTVPFGAGGIFPAGCSGSVHWSLNTVPVDSSEPLPPGIAAHCPALSVYILSVAHLSDHALRDSYEQAERFFALHASSLYENGKPLAVLCSTGLLWPALDAFLPEDSGIL